MRTSAELRREGGARPLRGADWPRRVGPSHLQQVRGADWCAGAGHAPGGTAPPAVGARPPPRTDGLAPRSAAAMADSAAQSSLISSTSSSTSVTSSSASSTRAAGGGCVGGSSMSCAVQELLFWRDVKKSAVAFGASLVLLLSLATLSAVTVVAHVALALLSVTISLRVYKAVVQALQKSEEGHPFKAYLDLDVTLSPETFQAHAAVVAQHLNRGLQLLIHLFLVEDLVDSLELALTMWLMTYVGAVFNGITLLILADILAFTLPPLYKKYEVQINHYMGLIRHQTKDLMAKIQAKLPGLAKKKPE
ncbi:reticulon-3-like isoform X5 [Vidua chalybeata]|uniref:reticulon-3-like isoform X5 n=1 Tax=Vidua chalybeata TaxID=81927 RepID=UPI0023A7AC46|nr:reticulon-3-like isoform X5 [Vidua chalybeata]